MDNLLAGIESILQDIIQLCIFIKQKMCLLLTIALAGPVRPASSGEKSKLIFKKLFKTRQPFNVGDDY